VDKKVRLFIQEQALLQNGDLVVLGVSGGPDSMALLHVLTGFRREMGIDLIVAHLNHCLRDQALDEELYVKEACLERGVPFYSKQRDIKALAACNKMSIEEAGREERYKFFNDIRLATGATTIATAHHQDDAAETVLLHLLRGSGIKGLRGIMPRQGAVVRPLLCVDKKEILQYLERHKIRYWFDYSNEDQSYLRNRIRHRLLPFLEEEFNPQIVHKLNQLADIARQENDWMDKLVEADFKQIVEINGDQSGIIIPVAEFLKRPVAVQRRLIHLALAQISGIEGWEMSDLEMVRDLRNKAGSARVLHLKKGVYARKVYGDIIISRSKPDRLSFSYKINHIPGRIVIPESGRLFCWEIRQRPFSFDKEGLYLDFDRLRDKGLWLRSRRPGDRISL